eukprot:COSAG06_NODE_11491_length_1502_cov_2.383464_1_plen_82_part_00
MPRQALDERKTNPCCILNNSNKTLVGISRISRISRTSDENNDHVAEVFLDEEGGEDDFIPGQVRTTKHLFAMLFWTEHVII